MEDLSTINLYAVGGLLRHLRNHLWVGTKWRWLATQDHAKLVYKNKHSQPKSSKLKSSLVNPFWGHRSISIDSDLGALQPYFLVVRVTQRRHFSRACSWMTDDHVDALKKPSFWRKSCRFGPLKLRFPPSSRPAVELYAVLVLVSGLLSWKWTVCQRSIPAAI